MQAGSATFQNPLHVIQHHCGLMLNVAERHFVCLRIGWALPGNEEKIASPNCWRVRAAWRYDARRAQSLDHLVGCLLSGSTAFRAIIAVGWRRNPLARLRRAFDRLGS